MSNDLRFQFLNASVLDQNFLNNAHDNLVNQLEMIVDIEAPDTSIIRASDRNKYVGGIFYEALLTFPSISRTVGEFLNPSLEFSTIELELSNASGRFNKFLPSGADFNGWLGNKVTVKLGLKDIASTYKTIFNGIVTDQGGFARSVKSISITARDEFDKINVSFPTTVFKKTVFPDLENDKEDSIVPIIYGDWTVNVEPIIASIPCTIVNGKNVNVNGDTGFTSNIQAVISNHPLQSFDTNQVYLKRSDKAWKVPQTAITSVVINSGLSSFEITQGVTLVALTPDTTNINLEYSRGDTFLVKVKGKSLGADSDNIIAQAKDLLISYSSLTNASFDANWSTFKNKNTPTQSAISTFKSRIFVNDQQDLLKYSLSLLNQVRLEAYIDKNLKLKILSLHFDDFIGNPTYNIKNWDIVKDSFNLRIDERTNFNKLKSVFNYLPNRKENYQETGIYKNQIAITQAKKSITKKLVFPNLYEKDVVIDQTKELLKIASAYIENINVNLTWRSTLLDVGDFVKLNVNIKGAVFEEVPCLIRSIGYDSQGMKIPCRMWSFQMLPYTGNEKNYSGVTGGHNATIELDN